MTTSRYIVPAARRGSILGGEELAALAELIDSGEILSQGRHRQLFEQRFRDRIGSRYAFSVTSGTVALDLAIHLLGLSRGDEVIVTPQTYRAMAQPLLDLDVNVRFCDIDPDTLNMDPEALRSMISERTRAVIVVHYGGAPAAMREIVRIAHDHGSLVLEDCAHALGASYHGEHPGALADIGCFSFHSLKNITTLGEGGMITFARDDWAERLNQIRSNRVDGSVRPSWEYSLPGGSLLPWMRDADDVYTSDYLRILRAGTNATLSEPAAVVGSVQLDRLDDLVERRRAIAASLDEVIGLSSAARPQSLSVDTEHAYHLYTFMVSEGAEARERLVRSLDRQGVQIELRYFPLHLLPEWRWRGHGPGECPVAERSWFGAQVNLPCYPSLSDGQVEHMTQALATALAETAGALTAR
ncbi:DegT/DnrJ/EryC1/StrS aminotransferase family protein [Amycolatopsis eburnea]|uniref:DegT/DnrJ/EryC1/StrS family aminotransferase n=1 Tax=Amycolatopsis eburnea TaxID=2267691 RepID=A0A3R9DTL6_9PSEU|nr:DegT/DnrJ/EryC1/StrS family aminotransferase [Amycolatopsis eburnea]RSD13173.1 DegT/DnrJ/EryC1/StrS family aminotransferase [Amycolatopsis eburnea]